ncbi:aminopeptidase P family protein [Lactobacillus sp. YT155]|uniref:M24 family metallopeptidase n=1 Tax=Lactobacillus sp. YT155 TaxID=3060955 RepID=UPI00265E82E1|nr:aminopeptidase P family protein [Lactobacillus sp. YT155]MDO1605837.1 aminopeptidase P family protein [Lactobacillus sp. YT155]
MDKVNELRAEITKNRADAMIINNQANRFYIANYTGDTGFVIISEQEQFIYTDGRFFEQIKVESPTFTIVDSKKTALSEFLKSKEIQRVIIEAEDFTAGDAKQLLDANVELIYTDNLIQKLRMYKTDEEIECISRAAQITDKVYDEILNYIKPGVKELDIATEIEYLGKKMGAEAPAFETIVASGVRSSFPHGTASHKLIGNHELIVLDFGFVVDQYYSDVTRTVAVGEISDELRQVYEVTKNAEEAAIKSLELEMKFKDVDKAARDHITEHGYGQYFNHSTGHGLGLEVHEYPTVNTISTEILKPNMVFTIEPGIYLPEKGGVRIEDDVYLNEQGEVVLLTNKKNEFINL